MLRRYGALCFGLFVPLQAVAEEAHNFTLREQLDRPYVALFELSGLKYFPDELKSFQSMIEEQRDQQIETCRRDEKRLQAKLDSARKGLRELNKLSSRDSPSTASGRTNLHIEISALEQVLRDKKGECERVIPATFEIKLAKVRLIERWPERRAETAHKIEKGRARERKHGDIDDIGYRKLVDDQEKDIAVGQQAIRQMASSGLLPVELQDAALQEYVRDLAGKIARNSDLKIPLHVTVTESPEINSIALPGGFLFVTSGLLLASETEAELAGVISQQIARIAARHATRGSKRSVISKLFVPATQVATGLFTGGVGSAGAFTA